MEEGVPRSDAGEVEEEQFARAARSQCEVNAGKSEEQTREE